MLHTPEYQGKWLKVSAYLRDGGEGGWRPGAPAGEPGRHGGHREPLPEVGHCVGQAVDLHAQFRVPEQSLSVERPRE